MTLLYRMVLLLLFVGSVDAADNQNGSVQYDSVASNVSFADVSALDFRESDQTLSYGEDALQFGKLWLPAEEPKALLVLLHGGCWLNQFPINYTYAVSTGLANAGYAVWSLEYRRIGDAGGGWPGTFEDVVAGINHVENLASYGLSANNLALLGHSAGGHLALLAGTDKAALTVVPDLVIGLAAISDVISYSQGDSTCQTAARAFMGGTYEEQTASYQEANPASQPLHPNSFLFLGDADEIVPIAQADLLAAVAHIAKNASHFDWVHPGTPAFASLIELLEESF